MTTRATYIFAGLLLLAAVVAGIYVYPSLPARVVSHWDAQGVANGTMGKFWGVFLIPIIAATIFLLIMFIPRLDPLQENIDQFRKKYNLFALVFVVVMLAIFALTLLWNLGVQFEFGRALSPILGALFIALGRILPGTKRNWFFGIRTPWTLYSDTVWDDVHRKAGVAFTTAGVIGCLGIFFPHRAVWLIIMPILVAALGTVIYSYFAYRRERDHEMRNMTSH